MSLEASCSGRADGRAQRAGSGALAKATEALRGGGAEVHALVTDVSKAEQVQALADESLKKYGAVHVLCNNAGIGVPSGPSWETTLDDWRWTIDVNLMGVIYGVRSFVPIMLEQGSESHIVNTASVAAFDGQIGQTAYSASKGGIVGMTLPIARDLARTGIRVVTIAPGIFDTPLLGGLPENIRQSLGEQVPFPSRLGQPAEFAALARHIVENQMLNGEVIRLDGALRMAPR